MYGICDDCGRTAELDCAYNPSTGEERWVCEVCLEVLLEDDED